MINEILETWLNKLYGENNYEFKSSDIIIDSRTPKSGLKLWVGIKKDPNKFIDRIITIYNDSIKLNSEEFKLKHKPSILGIMFTNMIISQSEEKAINVLKRFKPKRDWNMFEIESVNYLGIKYYIVYD